jgi:pimeloyl-ACP methyl ester carboxylesterase
MAFLRHFPERVQGAALCDTTAFPDTPERRSKREQVLSLIARGRFEDVLAPFIASVIWTQGPRTEAVALLIADMARAIGPEGYAHSVEMIRDRGDFLDVLAQARVPLLFISGEHDHLSPPALAEQMAALSPGGRAVTIPDAAHMSAMENPRAVAEAFAAHFRIPLLLG